MASNTAAIQSESTARASADSAQSTQINTVQAVANSKNKIYLQADAPTTWLTIGDIWYDSDDNNKSYRWDGTTWVAVSDVRISQNIAAIQSEITARSNADSALSSRIDLLSTRTSNSEAAIQAEQSARSSADNAMAQQITDLSSTVKNVDNSLNSKITSLTQSTTIS